jgi:hypothetical protein
MFYMQYKLVESIQQDRQREAAAERLHTSLRLPRRLRRRSLAVPLTVTDTVRRPRSSMPRTAV